MARYGAIWCDMARYGAILSDTERYTGHPLQTRTEANLRYVWALIEPKPQLSEPLCLFTCEIFFAVSWQESITYTFNSKQLRAIDVKMPTRAAVGWVVGRWRLWLVQEEARPRRAAAQAAVQAIRNLVFTAHQQHAAPPEQLWEIPSSEENAILLHCCA